MKKSIVTLVLLFLGVVVFAQSQAKPQWNSVLSDKPETFRTQLVSSTENSIQVNVQVPGFYATTVSTPRGEANIISVPKSVSTAQAGEPAVPMTGIPLMIGDKARMAARIIDAQYMDFEGIEVAPSKGDFPRSIDPETVPYTYGECYSQDAFFPASNLDLYEPYIIRDFRGQNMAVYPFAYNPATKTLRVYYNMTVEMYKVDNKGVNTIESRRSNEVKMDPDFKSVYQRHFLNYGEGMAKYTPVDEEGDLLIICYDNFISYMTDFVNWKKTRGINTTIVGTSAAGSTYSAIKTYIQNQYNANNNLTHVLLVGDVAQIPGYSYSGGGSSYSGLGDNAYGQIVGNDVYNDLFIGRFSAQTAAQVTTQVNRVITYERDLTTSDTWCQNGEGIGKTEGNSSQAQNGEEDYEHIENIRTDLINYGYNTVYQDYESTSGYSCSATTISNHFNSGVGVANYCNHGNVQMWGVASYSSTQVNNLTNKNKLPFIFSTACLVGKYDNTETSYGSNYTIGQNNDCFAEAWMHATYSSSDLTPTGAIGALMSYISQPWAPPMWAQDECIDILVESYSSNIKRTWGGVAINGIMGMFDHYSTSEAAAVGTYQAWVLYGDPSLMLRTKTPQNLSVSHAGNIALGSSSYVVNVSNGNGALATITDADHNILGRATVTNGTATISLNSSSLNPGTQLTLCVFGYNKVAYLDVIDVVGGTHYDITVTQPQHGTISAPSQAYANSTVTLTATPETGYCLSSWTVKAGNQTINVTNNQFTMPESNVTVTATFVQGMAVTLASVTNGTISADPLYALQGNTVNLTATPASGYEFNSWVVYKTGDVNTAVTVSNNSFTMPNYPVTVSAVFLAPQGGDVTIGENYGTTNGGYLPTHVWYKYSLTQQIYTADEVGSAGTITAISFYYNGSSSSGSRTIQMYMSHTTSSTISAWITQSSSNLVYSGTHEFSQGWNTITLNTPFEYNGTSNLLLTFDDNTGSYDVSSTQSFYTYSTGTTRAIRYYSDSSNLSATSSNSTAGTTLQNNNYIKITKEVPSNDGYLSVSPNSLSGFNAVGGGAASSSKSVCVIGANLQENVTVTPPTGYEVCATASGTYATTLTLTPTNGELRQNLYVRLKAGLTEGDYNGNMTIASGTATASVSLSGSVAQGSGTQYTITATANPAAGGTVSGAGTYYENSTCTLTATANTGYTFVNWTKNGTSVSIEATYSFTVNEATTLIANFSLNRYDVTATANPLEGGTVTVAGNRGGRDLVYDFEDGTSQGWTLLKGTTGNSPNNWMHVADYVRPEYATSNYGHESSSGWMLSESYISATESGNGTAVTPDNYLVSPQVRLGGSINFWVTDGNDDYGAEHFALLVSTTNNTSISAFTQIQEWTLLSKGTKTGGTRTFTNGTWYEYTVDLSAYSGMGYLAIRHFNCSDMWILGLDDITIVEGVDQTSGSGNFYYGETCVVTATPNTDYHFVNWTENGTVVSSNAEYSFTVTGARDLVANFSQEQSTTVTQTSTFSSGYNWWTANVDITLEELEAALGTNGLKITAQNGKYVSYNATYGWGGNLTALEAGKMYKIQMASGSTVTVEGPAIDPATHFITLAPGNNWIGFFGAQSLSVNEAFVNLEATAGDVVTGQNGSYATYNATYGWGGNLQTLEPGQAYTYNSKASSSKTFTFPSSK